MVIRVRLRHAAQAQVAVLAVLGREPGLVGADTARFNIMPHAAQIIIQDGADELVEAASVRDTMLVFQIDGAALVAAEEQVTVGIFRADVIGRNVVHLKYNGRLVDDAVTVLLFPAHQAEPELGVAVERGAHSSEQHTRVDRLGHADDMARRGGQVFMGGIHENGAVAVHIQQRVPISFIHIRHLRLT